LRWYHEAEERGDLFAITIFATGPLNSAWLALDDPDTARREAREAMRRWSHGGFHMQHMYEMFSNAAIDLYTEDPHGAYDRLARVFPAMARSLLMRFQSNRIPLYHVRGRVALARALVDAPNRKRLVKEAEDDAVRLERENALWAAAPALLQRAAVSSLRGDADVALAQLSRAAHAFDEADMAMHAAVARRRHGLLLGGDLGAAQVVSADHFLRTHGIVDPRKVTALLAPGFA
jgi:hypothetical protein